MESGNPEILRKIKKPGTVKNFIKAAETCRQYEEIVTSVFLIIGFPNENMSKILDTIEVATSIVSNILDIFSFGNPIMRKTLVTISSYCLQVSAALIKFLTVPGFFIFLKISGLPDSIPKLIPMHPLACAA